MRYKRISELQNALDTFSGKWELSPAHEVVYKERRAGLGTRTSGLEKKEAGFTAQLVAAEPDTLIARSFAKDLIYGVFSLFRCHDVLVRRRNNNLSRDEAEKARQIIAGITRIDLAAPPLPAAANASSKTPEIC